MASESVATSKTTQFIEEDAEDFNNALSMLYIASLVEDSMDADTGVHLRNVCNVAVGLLCNIRNRINPEGIEVEA